MLVLGDVFWGWINSCRADRSVSFGPYLMGVVRGAPSPQTTAAVRMYDVLHPRAVRHLGVGVHYNGNVLVSPFVLPATTTAPTLPSLGNAMPVSITCCSVYVL